MLLAVLHANLLEAISDGTRTLEQKLRCFRRGLRGTLGGKSHVKTENLLLVRKACCIKKSLKKLPLLKERSTCSARSLTLAPCSGLKYPCLFQIISFWSSYHAATCLISGCNALAWGGNLLANRLSTEDRRPGPKKWKNKKTSIQLPTTGASSGVFFLNCSFGRSRDIYIEFLTWWWICQRRRTTNCF